MSILKNKSRLFGYLLGVTACFLWLAEAGAVELFLPQAKVKRGDTFTVPIMIDQIDNLAGVKLILSYDPATLLFRDGRKTPQSQSMMHLINDKKPGRLVVVMASAKGIGGKDLAIIHLVFQALEQGPPNRSARIDILEAQLMSDQLKDVPCHIKPGTLKIE